MLSCFRWFSGRTKLEALLWRVGDRKQSSSTFSDVGMRGLTFSDVGMRGLTLIELDVQAIAPTERDRPLTISLTIQNISRFILPDASNSNTIQTNCIAPQTLWEVAPGWRRD